MADNRLELVVEVDTNRANASIKSVNASLSSMEASAVKTARGAAQGIDGMTAAMVKGATAGNLLADAIKSALTWAKEFTVGSVMMAAENAKAEASLKALANAHGVGAVAAARQVAAIEEIGFEFTEAAHAVQRLIVADLELSKAQSLAKLAKDAAAVQNIAAGEALESIVMAIESGASRGLRTLGLFVDFQKESQIAQLQLGRALTETEEKQLRYNAVIREGAKIQGAHAAASQTVEGQLGALRREFNNLREDIGAQFQDDFKALIGNLRGLVGWLRENTDLLRKFGEVALWVSGILATYALADKIMALAKSIAALQLASINPYALFAVGVVGAGFAIYSQWKDTQDQLQARFDEMQRKALREDLFSGRTSVDALRKQGMTDDQIRELVMGKRWLPGEQPFEYEGPKLTIKKSSEPDLEALKRAAEIRKRQLEVERESARALEEARRRGLTGFARDVAEVQDQIRKWTTFVDERGNEQRIALTREAWENVIGELRVRLANWQKEVQETNRKNLAEYLAAEEEAARRRLEIESHLFSQRLAYNEEVSKRNLDHLEQMLGIEEQRAGFAREAQLRALDATNAQTLEQKVAVEQRKAAIEIEYLTRVHEIRMRLFDLETSRMVIEEEAALKRLGYRADEIQARISELTTQRDEIRRFQQEATDAAIQGARETAAIRQAQLIRDHNERIFDSFKRQAEGVFDALLTKSQSIWSAIGNSLKTALLTAIKDVVSSRVAAMLMQLFTGTRVSLAGGGASGGGTLGRLGGLLGVGSAPVFGAGSGGGGPIPGGAAGGWGTPPFIPSNRGGGWSGLVGGWKDFFGFGGGVQYAPGKAVTWEAATVGQKLSALGRSNTALLGGATLALMGLQRGGVSGLAMTTAGGAMIGFKYGGPLGAAIGAGIGALAGLVRLFVKGAEEKAREKIKATYGVDIRDKGVLKQIVDIAKQGFGGNLEAAIRSQQIRDLVELYALSTGQGTSGLPATMRPVSLLQQGGSLFQSSSGGLTLAPLGGGTPSAAAAPTVINITVPGAKEFFEKETVRVVVENPRAVQSAAMTATKASAGRREMTGLQLSPGLIMS
jgi:Holliday junction resolvasome RuvABC DNA-binding subunit